MIVTRRLPESVEARAAELFDAVLNTSDEPLGAADLAEAMRAADGVLVTVTDRIDAAVLAAEPRRARIVANFGVGFDHIDLAAAAERGIVVTNTPGVLTDDTADLTMALLLAVMRRVGEGERHVRSGAWTGWRPTHMLGTRVTGATLGHRRDGPHRARRRGEGPARLRHAHPLLPAPAGRPGGARRRLRDPVRVPRRAPGDLRHRVAALPRDGPRRGT